MYLWVEKLAPLLGIRRRAGTRWVAPALLVLVAGLAPGAGAQTGDPTCGLQQRVPFAGHNLPLTGTPVPQSVSVQPAFPALPAFVQPLYVTAPPDGTPRLFVVEQPGRIHVLDNDPDVLATTVFLDITGLVENGDAEQGLLGLAFDPDYATNGDFYVNYTHTGPFAGCSGGGSCTTTRISRFSLGGSPDQADPNSELVLLEFEQPDTFHNAGMLAFGPDGMLYASVGDGGGPGGAPVQDPQDPNSGFGAILRLDPDLPSPHVPADNPFGNPTWHYGLRNPWRFSFDRATGDLWIGDVGDANREEVDFVEASRGGGLNFGWRECEGTVDLFGQCGSLNAEFPVMEFDPLAFNTVIGGYVYRGDRIPSLRGAYLFGAGGSNLYAWDRQTVDGGTGLGIPVQIASVGSIFVSFGEDAVGEIYLAGYITGQIFTLDDLGGGGGGSGFPQFLSQTGLFADTAALVPAEGLLEYEVNSRLWSDRALKQRWVALPAGEGIDFHSREAWKFPVGTVLVKHFELPLTDQPGAPTRRLETRLFLRQTEGWTGFTYRWNGPETDAELLTSELLEDFDVEIGGVPTTQTWTYPSPAGCLSCHTLAAGRVLGVRTRQLNRSFDYPLVTDNLLHAWNCIEIFDTDIGDPVAFESYVAIDDDTASIPSRARSYLASNCAHCHQPGTLSAVGMDMRPDGLLADLNVIGVPATENDLGLPSPDRIRGGEKELSVLWERMQSTDPIVRMARGTAVPHLDAVTHLGDWIDLDLLVPDSDEDGEPDATDNCPGVPNPGQENGDGGPDGDACDPDFLPDLEGEPTSPGLAFADSDTLLGANVQNPGSGAAPTSQVAFYLSLDEALDPSVDPLLGSCFAGPVSAAGLEACSDDDLVRLSDFIAPPPPGGETWFWIACADSLELVLEGDETDNCGTAEVLIQAPEPARGLAAVALLTLVTLRRMRRPRAPTSL